MADIEVAPAVESVAEVVVEVAEAVVELVGAALARNSEKAFSSAYL